VNAEQPEALHFQRERGRLQASGHRTDDDSICTLLAIHETDGRWAIHGLGAPGVHLTNAVIANLAEAILRMAR
jgi:hypothetical protein